MTGNSIRSALVRTAALLASCGMLAIALVSARGEEAPKEPERTGITVRASSYQFAPFGTVFTYRPDGEPRGIVLFLSGREGWHRPMEALATALARQGMAVAGVSTPALLRGMERSGACIDPNFPLVALSRDVQHRLAVKAYMKPVIVGYGSGATMAYGGIAQWANAGYQGAVSVGFHPGMPGRRSWCRSPGFAPRATAKPRGWQFVPNARIKVPWTVLQGRDDRIYTAPQALRFVAGVPGARLEQLPGATTLSGEAPGLAPQWSAQLTSAVTALLPKRPPAAPPGRISIPDMPITLVPPTRPGPKDVMAVIYSGDGGWVGIDRDIAAQLASAGIPVVGVDSLSYFWSARTPRGAGEDLSRIINGFSEHWNRPKVILIGYSFGGDAMPYMIENIDAAARRKIVSLSLLGLSSTADFQFHLMSWLDIAEGDALPTIPAVIRLKGMTIRCIRGATERDSACPAIPKGVAQQFLVPGDHHFNRNAPLLTRIILGERRPGAVSR